MTRAITVLIFLFYSLSLKSQQEDVAYSLISINDYHAKFKQNNSIKLVDYYNHDSAWFQYPSSLRTSELQPVSSRFKLINYWQQDSGLNTINVYVYNDNSFVELKKFIVKNQWLTLAERSSFLSIKLSVNTLNLELLLRQEFVKSVTFEHPQVETFNHVGRTNHRASELAANFPFSTKLTGKNVKIGEWDGGTVGNHIDFSGRMIIGKAGSQNSHATHVAGTVCGAGNLEPLAMGMAPEAKLYSWDFNGDIPVEMDTNKNKFGYVLTQNSYGYWTNNCADFALYDGTSYEMDLLSRKYTDLLHVFAAGNSRGMNCVAGGYKTILPGFQSAKNTLSVAAVTFQDGDASFSCMGPTQDGRFKPEVSAVGVNVYSTQDNNSYAGGWNGTSMACPGASGTIALLYEKFANKYGYTPPNFLSKNIVSNTADDLGNAGPDYKYGFGRINGAMGVNLIDSGFWNIDSVGNNNYYYDTIYLPSGLHELRVMLTYNDKEVSPSSNPKLFNDLDLTVTDSNGAIYRPWWCNPVSPSSVAVRKRDSINNIEQVTITNPIKGRYIFKVHGKSIVSGNQAFAITYFKHSKGIRVTYPNGNETMEAPSNTSKAQTIRWDSRGVTGNYNVDFSRDNGKTWVSIVTNIPNSQNYYTWQSLSDTVSTSKALIKVSSGSTKDSSDAVFNIAGIVNGITTVVCDSQVYLKWRKSPNTKFYRVYMLQDGKMTQQGTTVDTAFLISKLNNNVPYWFSVSRQTNDGAESNRARAISATPLTANKPPRLVIQPNDVTTCYSNLVFSKSTVTGTATITKTWEYSSDNASTWINFANTNDSINLKTYISLYKYLVRRKYTNVCQAPVYSRTALINLDSNLQVNFVNRDSVVCFGSVVKDSLVVKSKIKPVITWYNDSANINVLLKSGFETSHLTKVNSTKKIWASVQNLCGSVSTFIPTNPANKNGKNEYTLYATPGINIADTLIACIGENLKIQPVLTGGKPGQNQLIIDTDDSSVKKYVINRKINYNQTVLFRVFDGCYPDTIIKQSYIKMRDPLKVDLNSDSTICYAGKANIRAKASGGNKNYVYTWSDIGISGANRSENLTLNKQYKVTLTDNCTELPSTDSLTISVLPALSLDVQSNSDTLCWGNVLNLSTTVNGGRVSSRNINWKNSGLSGYSPSLIPLNNSWYVATISDGCSPAVKDSVFVVMREPLNISIDKLDTLCYNKTVKLKAQFTGGKPNSQIVTWLPMMITGVEINYTPQKTQLIKAVVTDGCTVPSATDSFNSNMFLPLELITIQDTNTCYGHYLKLKSAFKNGKNGTQTLYWNSNLSNEIVVDSFTTKTYQYQAIDGCKDTVTNFVKVDVGAKLKLNPTVIQKCSYDDKLVQFTVNTTKQVGANWDKLSSGLLQNLKNTTTESYMVELNDGCSDTSMVKVDVLVSDFSSNNLSLFKITNKQVKMKANKVGAFSSEISWGDGITLNHSDSIVTHQYQNYGVFQVCRYLIDAIGCTDTLCEMVYNNDPANFKQFNVEVYPNPTQGQVTIHLNQLAKDLKIELFDINSKLIQSREYNYPAELDTDLNIQELAKGVYIIRVTANGEISTIKLIKH